MGRKPTYSNGEKYNGINSSILEEEDIDKHLHLHLANQFTQTVIREAPGIGENRLMDLPSCCQATSKHSCNSSSPFSAFEQQGLTAAGTTVVGAQQ